jgi:hypothetical protein
VAILSRRFRTSLKSCGRGPGHLLIEAPWQRGFGESPRRSDQTEFYPFAPVSCLEEGTPIKGGGSESEMSDHIRDASSRIMVLKVRLILGVVILAAFGTLCCQKVWVVPFMTRRLPFSSWIEIG